MSVGAPGDIIIDSQGASRAQAGVGAVKFPHYECDKCHISVK